MLGLYGKCTRGGGEGGQGVIMRIAPNQMYGRGGRGIES